MHMRRNESSDIPEHSSKTRINVEICKGEEYHALSTFHAYVKEK